MMSSFGRSGVIREHMPGVLLQEWRRCVSGVTYGQQIVWPEHLCFGRLIWCFEILQYIKNLNFKKLKIAENVPTSVKERDHPYRFDLSVSFICWLPYSLAIYSPVSLARMRLAHPELNRWVNTLQWTPQRKLLSEHSSSRTFLTSNHLKDLKNLKSFSIPVAPIRLEIYLNFISFCFEFLPKQTSRCLGSFGILLKQHFWKFPKF